METLKLENLSKINTSYGTITREAKNDIHMDDYAVRLMSLIEAATLYRDDKDKLLEKLVSFEKLIHFDIPLETRPYLFNKLNDLLSHVFLTVQEDKELCAVFLNLITMVKTQIDQQEQFCSEKNETEWEELQRSIFLLGEWEEA